MVERVRGLAPEHRALVRKIVQRYAPQAQVWIFGSRAKACNRPYSDLDLLYAGASHLSWRQRADLTDAFEASELPFRVDLVEADRLAPGMRERIAQERVPL